jgi:GrpB-like predicted nucleotidyltransferase (UPF0157 family)
MRHIEACGDMCSIKAEVAYFVPESDVREKIARTYDQLKLTLAALADGAEIHHVGSTAIPGSLTKGDLDVQIRVTEALFATVSSRLRALYTVNKGGFTGTDAISFEHKEGDVPVGIHLTVIDGSCDLQYRFRDRLLASPSLQTEYDDLKRRFEGKSMQAYRDAKEQFVLRVVPEFRH